MTKRITIVDIAKATGFSISAVSKALADAPDISKATKDVIKKKCVELGYVQNINASSLKKGNSRIIGILYDSFLNPFYNEIVYYIELLLKDLGYSIAIYRSNQFDNAIFHQIFARNAEGLISFLTPDKDVEARIKKLAFPSVIVGRDSEDIPSVSADNEKIGQIAAQYALAKGAKRPFYVGESVDLPIVRIRRDGFESELAKQRIPVTSLVKKAYISNRELLEGLNAEEWKKTDFVFCFNDAMAFDVMIHLSKLGRKDVPVVGVDCVQDEIALPFSMASVGFDKEEMSENAVRLLLSQISGHRLKNPRVIVNVHLSIFDR